jgi:hypothetical protein
MAEQWYDRKNGQFSGLGDPIQNLIAGEHAGRNSPYRWLPESNLALADKWRYFAYYGHVPNSATDGAAALKVVLENSGTFLATSTVAGMEGAMLSTTGGADNNANHYQFCNAFIPAASKTHVFITRVNFPATPAATVGDFWFGFMEVEADPVDTPPDHGSFFRQTDASAVVLGRTYASTVTTDTATLFSKAVSLTYDLGVVLDGLTASYYYWKLSTATTWNVVKKTTTPVIAGTLRPSFGTQNGSAAAYVTAWDRFIYAGMR